MFTPAVTPYQSMLYALGNTPAASLTRAFPNGIDADVLLLGCGDVRNILYTAYCERGLPKRKLDITCCDIETGIIARNVALLSLLTDGVNADTAMDIYFHVNIRPESFDVLQNHTTKLSSLMESLERWQSGPYGSFIKFCDEGSLDLARAIIIKFAAPKTASEAKADLSRCLNHAKECFKALHGTDALTMTGLRSAAPVTMSAIKYMQLPYQHYWQNGTFVPDPSPLPNPLFVETLSENTVLHYGTDPILGFHLATAFAELGPASPLRPKGPKENGLKRIVEAARVQFHEWASAYQAMYKNQIIVRFGIADALTFGHTMQHASTRSSKPVNLFRRRLDASQLILNAKDYGEDGDAPSSFDIVDTSNLIDHLGAINLLIATAPLLKDSVRSVLYLETLVKSGATNKAHFDTLLKGHTPTISLLLGLAPVEYWASSTFVSSFDELMMGMVLAGENRTQCHSRLSFKLARHFLRGTQSHDYLKVKALSLAKLAFEVYHNTFRYEDPLDLMKLSREDISNDKTSLAFPVYHRGSFVSFTKLMSANVSTDYPLFWKHLLVLIKQDTRHYGLHYYQEFMAQLHIQGLHTAAALALGPEARLSFLGLDTWDSTPEVVCVTVEVPREHFDKLYATERQKISPPTLRGIVDPRATDSKHFFSCVQLIFGSMKATDDGRKGTVSIVEDRSGWQGQSAITISFYAPTNLLFTDPSNVMVGLSVQPTLSRMNFHTFFQPESSEQYMIPLNEARISKYLPGMEGYPTICERATLKYPNSAEVPALDTRLTLSLNLTNDKVDTICGHVDFLVGKGKELLSNATPIEMKQSSPTTIDVVFGDRLLIYPINFPCPVSQEHAKLRIARTTGYVEILAPLADPLRSKAMELSALPITLGKDSIPVVSNGHHINLDSLPILNVEASMKSEINWLIPLTSSQFSVSERKVREAHLHTGAGTMTPRLNVKDSLYTMFMLSSGVQGGQTGLFSINRGDLGICMLIFVSAIRIDGAAGSVVADAACLPLTVSVVRNPYMNEFLLFMRELEICAIEVGDEEMQLWMRMVPAMAERCRTWSHKKSCEYRKKGATIPLSTKIGEQIICSCGNGHVPDDFKHMPDWDVAKQHMVRLAISPIYPVPILESVVNKELLDDATTKASAEKCRNCNAMRGKNTEKLMKCSRCKEASYCSPECQKADWKKHRAECRAQTLV
ncbi:hypothetical protein GGR57DRAFT_486192 [Xylariaceae sp. FL1272]|nr:hypothetical protein GGR57DRAFT_486192 [Xylariaceae sp. FL1272]